MGAIKSCGILMSFCCILTSTFASSEVFDGVLGSTTSCHKTCQMTYSLHTYPRVSASATSFDLFTNKETERFSAIRQFVLLGAFALLLMFVSLNHLQSNNSVLSGNRLFSLCGLFVLVQEEALYACQRGCRLFSICQFVGDSKDLNETKSECESGNIEVLSN